MEYNEYDDYGMDSAEGGKEGDAPACDCQTSGTIAAIDALLTGRCDRCGWRD